jgi:hypothetical protein
MWTGNLIRFPQERRTAAVEDYREEPAKVLVLYIGQRHLISDDSADRCRAAFDELNRAVEANILEFWGPPICGLLS